MIQPEFLELEAVMLLHDQALASYGYVVSAADGVIAEQVVQLAKGTLSKDAFAAWLRTITLPAAAAPPTTATPAE